jgi:HSP20 family protein
MSIKKRNVLEDIFQQMNEIIREMIEDQHGLDLPGEPLVWGFSLSQRGNEPPEIREFGNMNIKEFSQIAAAHQPYTESRSGPGKYLVDILEGKDTLHVVMEMPGVNKEDITVDTDDTTLYINAQNGDRQYSERVALPAKVLSDSVKATYKNGVLEVIFNYDRSDRRSITID